MSASGAHLVEVGTTNRTRVADFANALSPKTALILKVHPSNYRIVGFTAGPTASDLAVLARKAEIPFVYDLGSGLLDRASGIPPDEPSATAALADGADLVVFSGDKLLGGPQAGIVLGRSDLVARLRRNPIARAVRVDKMQLAALESVLAAHAAGRRDDVPVWRMLREAADGVRRRAESLAMALDGELEGAHVVACSSAVGGGSLPGYTVPSFGVEVRAPDPNALAVRLRTGSPPVFCRLTDHGVLFDLRTVRGDELADLSRAIQYARESDDLDEG
jgi:L-seryl-tRNA(Ser) seleniumtransferase